MSTWWYVSITDGERKGPVSDDDLHQLLISGAVKPTTLVWKTGMEDWQPIAQVPDLASMLVSLPPPIPASHALPPPVPPSHAALQQPPTTSTWVRHLGSTFALILGGFMFVGGLGSFLNTIEHPEEASFKDAIEFCQGGLAIIFGALAYRSAKKRKLGEVNSTHERQLIEIALIVASTAIILARPNLKYHIATEPLIHLAIPVWVILAYFVLSGITYPPKDNGTQRTRVAEGGGSAARLTQETARLTQRADAAYERGDYGTALSATRWLAERGYAEAQNNLGLMYVEGKGVPRNYHEAMRWFRLAAEQGYAPAQCNLGVGYDKGRGSSQWYAEALKWYRRAAEQGEAVAQDNLGVMYQKAKGVKQDDDEAVKWYRVAAEQGYAKAQVNLGHMYGEGKGVPRDKAEAKHWYCLAADQNEPKAYLSLGLMYALGDGVAKDYTYAHKCLTWALAHDLDTKDRDLATKALDVLASEMTPGTDPDTPGLVSGPHPVCTGPRHRNQL